MPRVVYKDQVLQRLRQTVKLFVRSATWRKEEHKWDLWKCTRSAVLKVRSTDPRGSPHFQGVLQASPLFQLPGSGGSGFLPYINPSNRLEQMEADMRIQLSDICKLESKTFKEIWKTESTASLFAECQVVSDNGTLFDKIFMLTCKGFITVMFKRINKMFCQCLGFCVKAVNMGRQNPNKENFFGVPGNF